MGYKDTKTALLDCAQGLIQRVGVNAMSYNDLSKEVGIRKASIHYHFPKKEDLIIALQDRCQTEYGQMYMNVVDSENSAVEKLRMLTRIYADSISKNKLCVIAMLSAEYETLGEKTRELLDESVQQTARIYEKVFIQGLQDGEFSGITRTFDAAYAFLSLLMGAHILARCSGGVEALKCASEAYIESLICKN